MVYCLLCIPCYAAGVFCCIIATMCVDEQAYVVMANGKRKKLAFLKVGDRIKTLNELGELEDTQVMMFAHVGTSNMLFHNITTESNKSIKVSATHLVSMQSEEFKFARDIKPGDVVLTYDSENDVQVAEKVVSVIEEECHGFMAPITEAGTFLANDVLLSCYAEVKDHSLAHAAMEPVRWWNLVQNKAKEVLPKSLASLVEIQKQSNGVHWYPTALYALARPFVAMGSKENIITGELDSDEQLDKTLFMVS